MFPPHPDADVQALIEEKIDISECRRRKVSNFSSAPPDGDYWDTTDRRIKMQSNKSFDADTHQHFAARRRLTSTPDGAMPLRAGQPRP
jgi:hypothetical protein